MKRTCLVVSLWVLTSVLLWADQLLEQEFAGTDRKAAKTSIANAQTETYKLNDLIVELHQTENKMLSKNIPEDAASDRVQEEKRNVRVRAWLHAFEHQKDNDYHLILGTQRDLLSTGPFDTKFLTAEITGLPTLPHNDQTWIQLHSARSQLLSMFPGGKPASGTYTHTSYYILKKPTYVEIEGSLFFDVDHPAGAIGPKPRRPQTAWEIHPVTSIKKVLHPSGGL
ncbi:MAG TPA: hypothetical protein VIW47_05280 [Nitrospiraceae bacterium]|jgi:hypothetical protein